METHADSLGMLQSSQEEDGSHEPGTHELDGLDPDAWIAKSIPTSPDQVHAEIDRESRMPATHEVLPLGAVLVVPADNMGRGGRLLPPTHPDIVRLVPSIAADDLLHDVGVRPLPEPLPRSACPHPCCGQAPLDGLPVDRLHPSHHTHRLAFGFSRYVAHRVARCATIACKVRAWSDDDCLRLGALENLGRTPLTDYDIAMMLQAIRARFGWDTARLAREVGARPYDVDQLVRIAEACPPALLDRFAATPTREMRHALARISRIQGRTPRETHAAMLAAWAAQEAALQPGAPRSGPQPPGRPPGSNALGRAGLGRLAASAATADAWFDPATGVWRPVDAAARALVAAVLAHAQAPQTAPSPFPRRVPPGKDP